MPAWRLCERTFDRDAARCYRGASKKLRKDFGRYRAFGRPLRSLQGEHHNRYRHPMDLADASIVAAAEALSTRRVFTIDRKDIETYRVRRGDRYRPVEIVS